MAARGFLLALLLLGIGPASADEDAEAARRWLRDAAEAAHDGKPREGLVEEWERCARALPENGHAKAMVGLYEGLLSEDLRFEQLDPKAVGALSPERQAAYRVHELRDVALLEHTGRYQPRTFLQWPKGNPVDQLVDLGWDAIPTLIEHLDDPRPTRSARTFESGLFETVFQGLFTHGDLARLALRAITGRRFTTTHSGRLWWNGVRERGATPFFLDILGTPTSTNKAYAARWLVERDRDKNLPLVLKALGSASPEDAREVLRSIEGAFDASHRPALEKHLKSDDLLLVATATRLLWARCRSDAGVARLVALLRSTAANGEDTFFFQGDEAVASLAAVDTEEARILLRSLIGDDSPVVRRTALPWAARLPYPEILDALMDQMTDATPTGLTTDLKNAIRFRDLAAESAATMLRYPKEFPRDEPADARDAFIVEMRAWIANQHIDWAKLRSGE